MSYFLKITWTKKNADAEVGITESVKLSAKKGLQAKSNNVTLQLKNAFKEWIGSDNKIRIVEDDVIKIYAAWEPIDKTNPDHLIFIGDVISYGGKLIPKSRVINIKCADKTWLALNKVWSQAYSDTPDDIIRNVISHATGNSNSASGDEIQIPTDSEKFATARTDGSAFPSVQVGFTFKSIFEWIEQMSSTQYLSDASYTEPRDYIFLVDEDNKLNWFAPKDAGSTRLNGDITSSDATITVDSTTGFNNSGAFFVGNEWVKYSGKTSTTFTGCTRGNNFTLAEAHSDDDLVKGAIPYNEGVHNYYDVSLEKNTDQQINMIIYRCGKDLFGNGITWYCYYTGQSGRKSNSKLKIKYYNWPQISNDVLWFGQTNDMTTLRSWTGINSADRTQLNGGFGTADATITVDSTTGFASSGTLLVGNPQEYNFVAYTGTNITQFTGCTWNKAGSTTNMTWADDTPVYEATGVYTTLGNDVFRSMCKKRGFDSAFKILTGYADLRWKGSLEVRGFKHVAGDMIYANFPSIGCQEVLRIHDVTHMFGKDTWRTSLSVEQDPPKQAT